MAESFQTNPDNEQFLFHGTNRFCRLGERNSLIRPCSLPACNLCSIIRGSFDVKRCGTNIQVRVLFLQNTYIYQGQSTTFVVLEMEYTPLPLLQVSLVDDGGLAIVQQWNCPEADDYVLNGDESLRFRVLLLNRVIVGKPHRRQQNATWLTEPPYGHQSVCSSQPWMWLGGHFA